GSDALRIDGVEFDGFQTIETDYLDVTSRPDLISSSGDEVTVQADTTEAVVKFTDQANGSDLVFSEAGATDNNLDLLGFALIIGQGNDTFNLTGIQGGRILKEATDHGELDLDGASLPVDVNAGTITDGSHTDDFS